MVDARHEMVQRYTYLMELWRQGKITWLQEKEMNRLKKKAKKSMLQFMYSENLRRKQEAEKKDEN